MLLFVSEAPSLMLESHALKLPAGLSCRRDVGTSSLKLVQSFAAGCLDWTKLVAVGAAFVAGCSSSKLGSCALSSSLCCTNALLLEALMVSPCLCRLEAGKDKLHLFLC